MIPPTVSLVVPTFNEAPNIVELLRRVGSVAQGLDLEVVFVDDSTDDTPAVILAVAATADIPVRLIHRTTAVGGLSGAVLAGLRSSTRDWCVVMDGDLQHPPELIPVLIDTAVQTEADVAVASRHTAGGSAAGLDGAVRQAVSATATALTRAMFPLRLRDCTDPMTGFFAVRREALDLDRLRPQGFKILLEILGRHRLRVVEEPFAFADRHAGESKASVGQGIRFLSQLAALRCGRMSRFALIGAVGAVANILIMAVMLRFGAHYLPAAAVAAVATILGNFALQERFVFADLRAEGRGFWRRFGLSVGFNGAETLLRLPVLAVLVTALGLHSLVAQAVTLATAFLVRFLFQSRVVYRPRRSSPVSPLLTGQATEVLRVRSTPGKAAER